MSVPRCRCWNVARDGHQPDCEEERVLDTIASHLLGEALSGGTPPLTVVSWDWDGPPVTESELRAMYRDR